jgi:hypothetical protein
MGACGMMMTVQRWVYCAGVCALLGAASPALSADLGPAPAYQLVEPPASGWTFSFTPYAWLIGIDGNVTARGRTVDVNESFIDIAQESNSFAALMGYFEARKGRFSLFTDAVWADLGFPGDINTNFNGKISSNPFARLPNFTTSIKGNLRVDGTAQLDYQSLIVQSGATYEVAKWGGNGSGTTALDVLASARYWNQEANVTLNLRGRLDADVRADIGKVGLKIKSIKASRATVVAQSGTLEWVDPVVGARVRHEFVSGSEFNLEGDVGGFGAGSEFSWQAVATYAFDVKVFQTTMRSVVGYRALSVDFSENGRFGKNGIDWIEHGPVVGVSFRW